MLRISKTICRSVIVATLLLLSSLCVRPDSPPRDSIRYAPAVDSLLNLAGQLSDMELLRLWQGLHYVLYELNDADAHLSLIQHLADRVKADRYEFGQAFAYMLRVDAMYNYNLPDSIQRAESLQALDFMRKVKDNPRVETYYFTVAFRLVENCILSENYDEALELSGKFYAEAKEKKNIYGITAALKNMGMAYDALKSYDKAVESYRDVIAMHSDGSNIGIKAESYRYLVDLLLKEAQPDEALKTCRQFEAFIRKDCETNTSLPSEALGRIWFYCSLCYADTYCNLGQYDPAGKYIAQADTYPLSESALGIFGLEEIRFNLWLAQGKCAEAEKSLDRIDEAYGEVATLYDKLRLLNHRAELYYCWEKYDKAAGAYKEYSIKNDSIQRIEAADNLNSLRTKYEVDKLEIQKEQQRRTFRNTLLWLFVALVLSCAVIAITILNARKLRSKNLSLLDRIRERDELEKRNEQLRGELAGKNLSSAGGWDGKSDQPDDLCLRIGELMKDPVVFTDPTINRRRIAEKLGTNERYVFNTIRNYYGMSISEYITHLRLNYAREILACSPNEHTIEAVAFDAGFGNRVTFHRLFRERFGMTPDEFRKLVTSM